MVENVSQEQLCAVRFQAAVHIPQETQEMQLISIPIVVATIKNKIGHTLIKQLSSLAPLTELRHLKRTQRSAVGQPDELDIIVCDLPEGYSVGSSEAIPCSEEGGINAQQGELLPLHPPTGAPAPMAASSQSHPHAAVDSSAATLQQHLPAPIRDLLRGLGVGQLRVEHGSRHAPRTREHWAEWSKQWPITWRVPEGPPPKLDIPTETQVYFEQHMQQAMQLSAQDSQSCCCNAAVIVDPSCGRILAAVRDASHAHPLHHAVMVAVEAVAAADRSTYGRYEDLSAAADPQHDSQHSSCACTQQGDVNPVSETGSAGLPRSTKAVVTDRVHLHSAGKYENVDMATNVQASAQPVCVPTHTDIHPHEQELKRPRLDTQQAPSHALQEPFPAQLQSQGAGTALQEQQPAGMRWPQPSQVQGKAGAGNGPPVAQASSTDAAVASAAASAAVRPYLCTGYDCFVVHEPCIMCAMALVHSRVARVVYAHADAAHGALGGALRLHAQRTLNHHYEVYHLQLAAGAES